MILALGQNINSTLSTSPELFLANLRDVTEELAVDTIEWSGWGGTIGASPCCERCDEPLAWSALLPSFLRSTAGLGKSGLTIWGFAPSTLHLEPCPLPPTAVNLPFRARAFVGSESLEAVVDEAGHLCVPDETSGCWSFAEDRDEGGWLDVQQLGTGDFLGLHGTSPTTRLAVLEAACRRSASGPMLTLNTSQLFLTDVTQRTIRPASSERHP
jgi:hypothetical protein